MSIARKLSNGSQAPPKLIKQFHMHTIIHNDDNKTKCICVSNCLRKYVTPCGGYYWPTLVSLYDRSHAFNPFGLTDAMIHKCYMHTELFFLHYFFCCCSPLPLPLTLDYCVCVCVPFFFVLRKHCILIEIIAMYTSIAVGQI